MPENRDEKFVCEEMKPESASFDSLAMTRGEPGLPARFTWRGTDYTVTGVLEKWKTTGPCDSGAAERYVRRHWFRIRTDPPETMTVYCDRRPRDRKRPKARWWVYSVAAGPREGCSDIGE